MNVFKISAVLALLVTLSGCMTSFALSDSIDKSKKERHTLTHTDSVIAIGKPATPIQGYENALALVGQRYSYLVQPDDNNDDTLLKIFETVDLKSLSLNYYSYTYDVKQAHDDWACTSSYGCTDITLTFSKDKGLTSPTEMEQLERLGFKCYPYTYENHSCSRPIKLAFTITNPIKNPSQLTHQLSKPVTLQFYQFDADHDKKSIATKKALQPLAFVFDIITFPVQMFLWEPKK